MEGVHPLFKNFTTMMIYVQGLTQVQYITIRLVACLEHSVLQAKSKTIAALACFQLPTQLTARTCIIVH
jgi:hypothetical protein